MKSSGVRDGCANAAPKVLICWNSGQNPCKSGQKWHPTLLDLKKWRPRFAEKPMKTFFGGQFKKRSWWTLWEKNCRQSCTNNFYGQVWGHAGKNRTPKMCLLKHLWCTGTSSPVAPHFEKTEAEMPPSCVHSPASLCILFYTQSLHSLL